MHKPCPTCGDDGDKWAGQSGGLIVGEEGKPTVQCQSCGTYAMETTWNAPRAYERKIAALEAEVLALRKDAERLDYIQKNARSDPKMDGKHVWWPTSFNHAQNLKGPTVRAAIDAAIEAERGEG